MGRLLLAFKVFFRVLSDGDWAARLEHHPGPSDDKAADPPKPEPPARSEALTLLAALQREARLVDFLQESLDAYEDAQIGAAVRDIHRGSREVVAQMFGLVPVVDGEEGDVCDVPDDYDAATYRLTGDVTSDGNVQGRLVHHGWRATKCELPVWNGRDTSALVLAPAEVEIG